MKNYYFTFRAALFFVLFFAFTKCIAQKQGQEKIDSLKAKLISYKSPCNEPCLKDSNKVNLLNSLSWELKRKNPDTCFSISREALQLSKKIKWETGIGQSEFQLGWFYFTKGKQDEADSLYNEALAIWNKLLAQDQNNKHIKIKKSTTLAAVGAMYSSRGNYFQAIEYNNQALAIDSAEGNNSGCAKEYAILGIANYYLGNYPSSIQFFLKALKVAEELKDSLTISRQYVGLGNVYNEEGDFKQAISYYEKAMKIHSSMNSQMDLANDFGNIGVVYKKQGDFDKALDYALQAYSIYEKLGTYNLPVSIINIGNAYYMKKNYAKALEYYLQALEKSEGFGNKNMVANSLLNIGNAYAAEKKYPEAENYFFKSLKISEDQGQLNLQLIEHNSLFDLYKATGNCKKALEHYIQATAIKDTLFNQDKTEEITRNEMNYEFDKKEAITKTENEKIIAVSQAEKKRAIVEMELQKQKVIRNSTIGASGIIFLIVVFLFYKRKRDAEQRQKEMALSLQVSETEMKALRSQMNPHFIFNALQSIQTFLLSHKSEEANLYLLKFSKLMRAVLENSQHSEVSLKDDMQALELYMQLESIRLPHPFTYQFHIDESVDVETDSLPPLILQPFVENAIWHGLQYKPESGHINIFITKKDNALHATVEDNGVGRDMSKQVAQPMLLKKESIGIKLTEQRLKNWNELKKIKAQFKIVDLFTKENKPVGTRVELLLPLVA